MRDDTSLPVTIFAVGSCFGPAVGGLVFSVVTGWTEGEFLPLGGVALFLPVIYVVGILPALAASALAALASRFIQRPAQLLAVGALCGFLGTFVMWGMLLSGGWGPTSANWSLILGGGSGFVSMGLALLLLRLLPCLARNEL